MTNATKTLAIVFAGSLTLALMTSWSWSTTSSAAFQTELLAVDTGAVQAVRIERPDAPLVQLQRSDTGWVVAPADTSATYPAGRQAVTGLLNNLPSLQVGAVATRQPEKHPRYGVDSTGTTVTLLGENETSLGQLIVGRTRIQRPQSSGQGRRSRMRRQRRGTPITYVRSPDRPDVYAIEKSLQAVVTRSVEDWRDTQIWAVDRTQIQRIDFRYPADSSFTVRRVTSGDSTASRRDAWVTAGDTLSRNSASALLRTLSSPQAEGFRNNMTPEDLTDPLYTLRLHLADGSQRTLRLRPSASGPRYVAAADGWPYVAELRASTWDRSVLQGRASLLKTP